MSKRTIILSVLAVLLFAAALFSIFQDAKKPVIEEDLKEEDLKEEDLKEEDLKEEDPKEPEKEFIPEVKVLKVTKSKTVTNSTNEKT